MQKILILKGRYDPPQIIDAIAQRWTDNGFIVLTHYGFKKLPAADMVILHVDQTEVPHSYVDRLMAYPVVLNRRMLNISKARFSRILVTQNDTYIGPVIVKSNANCGGMPEVRFKRRFGKFHFPLRLYANFRVDLATTKWLYPLNYPIFNDRTLVPAGVWENPNLIAERFLPEKENGLYYIRYWMFLGDRGWAARFGSKNPIVKFSRRVTPEEQVAVPDELKALRKKIGIDYGRFDFVVHDGLPIVFDVNKTVGGYKDRASFASEIDMLAKGISSYLT